ncbi:MAG: flagellar biosynthetic protein FliO [Burkholderiaceae bacterium]|nr:flagellar biosynthetic protein FliO [Burkholderiaceae bacterium]
MTASSILGPLAAFALILALIPVALWLLKRSPLAGLGGTGGAGAMRVVAALALAPNQRIVTVEVGGGDDRCWLVLGVTPAGIRTLHTLPPQADAATAAAAPLPLFSQLLQRQRGGAGPGSTDAR